MKGSRIITASDLMAHSVHQNFKIINFEIYEKLNFDRAVTKAFNSPGHSSPPKPDPLLEKILLVTMEPF